jgi:hypothetical protein
MEKKTMTEAHNGPLENDKIDVMIAIAAAVVANCIPCFDHLYENALVAGLSIDEIKKAVDIANKVKMGAHNSLERNIRQLMDGADLAAETCCGDGASCQC